VEINNQVLQEHSVYGSYAVRQSCLPQAALTVCDSSKPTQKVLLREALAAVLVLLVRLRHGLFVNHHTLPVGSTLL
jgi:hypothetical protein